MRRRLSCFFATFSASVGRLRLGEPLLEPVELLLLLAHLAELLLDRLELLAQDVLALVLPHLLLDCGVDRSRILRISSWRVSSSQHTSDALLDVDRLEQLPFSSTGASRLAATRSARWPGCLMISMSAVAVARQLGHELDDLLGDVAQAHAERLGLDVVDRGLSSSGVDARLEVRRSPAPRSSTRKRARPCTTSE